MNRAQATCIASVLALCFCSAKAAAQDVTVPIRAHLQERIGEDHPNFGIVVGLLDQRGTHFIGYGKLGNGTDQDVNADTLFEIGSITKTFTAVLLQDMVDRKEVRIDDPVEKYLPDSVKVPSRNGKRITLRHLITHSSGLPAMPDNLGALRADNPYAQFTVERLYDFLSGHTLEKDPGESSGYSNLGVGLLAHALATRADASYESLVLDRICKPLGMESTRIEMSADEREARFAMPHNRFREPVPSWDLTPAIAGAGALKSSANDLLRYAAGHLGLTKEGPLSAMRKSLDVVWTVAHQPDGTKILWYSGGTAGSTVHLALDPKQRRAVVILKNVKGVIDDEKLFTFLLRSAWSGDHAPRSIDIDSSNIPKLKPRVAVQLDVALLDGVTGEYEFPEDAAFPGGLRIRIWRENDHLIWQGWGKGVVEGVVDLCAESESSFYLKLTDAKLIFTKDSTGRATSVLHIEPGWGQRNGRRIE